MIDQVKAPKLLIFSTPESLNQVENLIEEVKDEHKINEDCYGNMIVAVTEAVNNAIYHGNKSNPDKKVAINCEVREDKIAFMIADEGEGFDFYNLPDPTAPENIDKPNGRGVFLMKHLADQLIFSENGRIVELQFKIN
jgi:serine/threonine-protein kinase RsbW